MPYIMPFKLLKICSVFRSWYFWEGDVENYWVPSKQLHALFLRTAVFPRGCMGIYWRQTHQNCALFRIMWGKSFLSVFRIKVEFIRWIGRPPFVGMVQGCLVAATPAACWHTSTKTGTIYTGLMCNLLMSRQSAPTTVMGISNFLVMLLNS